MAAGSSNGFLVLGWHVNAVREPEYWRRPDAKAGNPEQEKFLFKIPARTIANHTAVIAQSGSGKSFFLGRLVEEIALRTKSRCLIFDPNADFKKFDQIEDEALWNDARYDPVLRRGKLPHEQSRAAFSNLWSALSIKIRGTGSPEGNYESLKLWLPSLSMEFVGEDLDPMLRSDLYHCHSLVQALDVLWKFGSAKAKNDDLCAEAQKLFASARTITDAQLRNELQARFIPRPEDSARATASSASKLFGKLFPAMLRWRTKRMETAIEQIVAAPRYVSEHVERFYFGKIRQYTATSIVETRSGSRPSILSQATRIEVVDLPSMDKSTRLLAVDALLNAEWDAARKAWNAALNKPPGDDVRVPTFVIVDEAHNLMPSAPQTKAELALRDQFRRIVAEGRKFGLFLILVSQRPDKLDPVILGECENKAIMRLGSASVLELTRKMLGLEDIPQKVLDKALELEMGRVILFGPWAGDSAQLFYSAARRTVEGGRNLRSEHWAVSATGDADSRAVPHPPTAE
jgi:hypothetical protein